MSRVRWDDMMGRPTYGSERGHPAWIPERHGIRRVGNEDPDIEAFVDHADVLSPVARVQHNLQNPGVMAKV